MTILKGIPDVPANTPLSAQLTYVRPYQQGVRLGIGTIPLTYDWGQARWENADGSAFDLVAARYNQNDPAPAGEIRLLFKTGSGAGAQAGVLNTLPVETAAGELDITVPVGGVVFVSGPTAQALIASLTGLKADVTTGLASLNAGLASIPAGLADIAQSAALASAAAGLIPTATYAAIPATAGVYRIMTGADAGQVWERAGVALLRRIDLEAAPASRTARVRQVPLKPTATAAQNAAIFRATVDAADEFEELQYPGGSAVYAMGSIGAITKSLTINLNRTRLSATIATSPTTGDALFWFTGSAAAPHTLTACTKGALTITLATPADAANYAVGNWVQIEDNFVTLAWDNPDGLGGQSPSAGSGSYSGRNQLAKVVSIAGAVLGLNLPLEFAYSASPKVRKVTLLDRPRVINGRIAEVDPGYARTGPLVGANASHLTHFQYCLKPQVTDCEFDGWNVHAVNFTNCVDPYEAGNIGRSPFRPHLGGHGYLTRLGNCLFGLCENSVTYGVRHHVDWVQSFDGQSQNNRAYDVRGVAYLNHGFAERGCKSVDDFFNGVVGSLPGPAGWGAGNSSFSATYDFTVVRPKGRGYGDGISMGYKSVNMLVIDPDIICTRPVLMKTGADGLTIAGVGLLEATTTNPPMTAAPSTWENYNGQRPKNLTILGRITLRAAPNATALIALDLDGDVILDGAIFDGGSNQIHYQSGATARLMRVRNNMHRGVHQRSFLYEGTAALLDVEDNTYQEYTSYAFRIPYMAALRLRRNRLLNVDGTTRSDGFFNAFGIHPLAVVEGNSDTTINRVSGVIKHISGTYEGTPRGVLLEVNEDAAGAVSYNINPQAAAGQQAQFRLFRGLLSGSGQFVIFKGDGTGIASHTLVANGDSNLSQFGNLGIGISPAAKLHVGGDARFESTVQLRTAAGRFSTFALADNGGADAVMNIDPVPTATGAATLRAFRGVTTTGAVNFQVLRGDGTSTANAQIGGNGSSYVQAATGNFAVGMTTAAEKLHVTGSIKITSGVLKHNLYTKATLPSASASGNGAVTYVSDPAATKGPQVYSNGTAWLYVRDDTTV